MESIAFQVLDCETFSSAASRQGVTVTEVEDLSGKVPHVGYGGASKSTYTSPKSGKTIYVLERNGMYAPDAYQNEVWQFENDFTIAEAHIFLAEYDEQYRAKNKKDDDRY